MKVSVITVCFNSADTVTDTVRSVIDQTHHDVQYIMVDGGSTDGTLDILARYRDHIDTLVSEPDAGIYDAMNKGINLATGQIVGFLNADDIYADENVISEIATAVRTEGHDAVYGDLVYVPRGDPTRVLRFWEAGEYHRGAFHIGWVPPHPTFFCRRALFAEYGGFDPFYRIAGDFELMLRLIERHGIRVGYVPRPLVRMRVGGRANTIHGMLCGNREILHAFASNGLKPSLRFFWHRPFTKLGQLTRRRGPKARRTVTAGAGTHSGDH